MNVQSRTQMRQTVSAAERAGRLGSLYYYVLMRVPKRYRTGWRDDGLTVAVHPLHWIPVVPLMDGPELAELLADLLRQSFVAGNPADHEFIVQLTTAERLEGHAWYCWGDVVEMDCICLACGCVGRVAHTVAGEAWLCGRCAAEWEGSWMR